MVPDTQVTGSFGPTCPRCRTRLDGGPILYRCPSCQRAVYAADLNLEVVARKAPAVTR
ncbi:hypothetical protein ACFV0L_41320 [Streptosporangium canum]|uniref:hypothetical protein n=1 Tax=Streptosporangium canum TaxID=324952 RepID=UPI0036B2DC65